MSIGRSFDVVSKVLPSREFENFEKLIDRLLSVPRAVLDERLKIYRDRAATNPVRRGPKPKKKP